MVAFAEPPLEHSHGERILNQPLNRSLERAGAESGIVAFLGEQTLRVRRDVEADLALGKELSEPFELQIDDALDVLRGERTKDDDVVDAVEKLRLELLPQRQHDRRLDERPVAARVLEDE